MKHLFTLKSPLAATLATLAAVVAATAAQPAQAQIVNGDFANGLTGWSTDGDASVSAANAVDPTRLWLTTASVDYADDFDAGLAAGARNVSGVAAADVGTGAPTALEGFTGVAVGAFDPQPGVVAAYEGSAAQQTFSTTAGSRLQFRWDLGTLDATNADAAFVVIDGHVTTLGVSTNATLPGTDGNAKQTGWANFGYTFASAGLHTISFGVVDVGDYDGTSTLAIANVGVSPVPEAPTLAMMMAGLGLLSVAAKRRSR